MRKAQVKETKKAKNLIYKNKFGKKIGPLKKTKITKCQSKIKKKGGNKKR